MASWKHFKDFLKKNSMAKLKPAVNDGDHMQGNTAAPVQFVEYGDYQCPHCAAAFPMIKQICKKFKDELLFVFRHFPLTEIHPMAQPAAMAAEAAGLQGRFWEMHDLIFENQPALQPAFFLLLAEKLKLNLRNFQRDLQDSRLAEKVDAQFESGVISGVNGTPSFFINGNKYEGDYNIQSLSRAIKSAITQKA